MDIIGHLDFGHIFYHSFVICFFLAKTIINSSLRSAEPFCSTFSRSFARGRTKNNKVLCSSSQDFSEINTSLLKYTCSMSLRLLIILFLSCLANTCGFFSIHPVRSFFPPNAACTEYSTLRSKRSFPHE